MHQCCEAVCDRHTDNDGRDEGDPHWGHRIARAAHNAGKDLRDGHCNVTDGENAHHMHAGINDVRRTRKHFHEITAEEQDQRNKYHGNGKAEL